MLEEIYRKLIERRAEMALSVFDSPPQDFAGFKQRLGAYVELAELINIVKEVMSGQEDDDGK